MSNSLSTLSSARSVGASDRAEPASENLPAVVLNHNSKPFNPDLEVSFACPECEHTCRVLWEQLANGMECPACDSSFHILPDRLQRREQKGPAEISFHCPRCRHLNSIPASRVAQGATCGGCLLELLPGPDKKLHDREELHKMKAQVRQQRSLPKVASVAGFDPDKLRFAMLAGAALFGVILVLWSLAWAFHTPTVNEIATDFTELCLTDKNSPLERVAAEEAQQKEFQRWWIMHFSSLSVAVKNAHDWPEVTVTVVKAEPSLQTLRVEMSSPVIGNRTITQLWLRDEATGSWRFDAIGTLNNLHAAD